MAVNRSQHPFFGVDNLRALQAMVVERVREETGKTIEFPLTSAFVDGMIRAADEYSQWLRTPDPATGVANLNDLMVRRAVRELTVPDLAGQYAPGNRFHRLQKRGKRCAGLRMVPEYDLEDPDNQKSKVTLDNPYRRVVWQWWEEDRQRRERRTGHDDLFDALRPENFWTPDRAFRH